MGALIKITVLASQEALVKHNFNAENALNYVLSLDIRQDSRQWCALIKPFIKPITTVGTTFTFI